MAVVVGLGIILFVALIVGSFNKLEEKVDVLNKRIFILQSTIEVLHAKEQLYKKD
jgi:uncharacterized protein YoxC